MYAFVTNLNTADLLMAIVIVTIVCTGWRCGVIAEFVKLFGILCTTFIALHYYGFFANYLRVQFFGKNASTEFFAFSILAILFSVIFMLISRGWVLILKFKPHAVVNRYGGLFLASLRSYFTCGLIFFGLLLIGHSFATPQAQRSVSGAVFRHVAANFYRASYWTLVANFFPDEAIHEAAFKVTAVKMEKKQEK
jgi:uncharacterized membrane protein required for colicin V production